MRFDTPATTNPIDRLAVVGKPLDRVEGPLKVSGRAIYAYEQNAAAPHAAYGCIIGAAVAKGRIVGIDDGAARRAPGFLAIVTYENAGPVGPPIPHRHGNDRIAATGHRSTAAATFKTVS